MKSWNIYVLSCLAVLTGGIAVYFFTVDSLTLSVICLLTALFSLLRMFAIISRFFRDVENFSEAARYRDFSKKYPERKGWRYNNFYHYFNEISSVFQSLNKEKELQQQYLKKMLELIDTGILAYNAETKEVLWLNEAFKKMFNIPSVKNIDWIKSRQESLYRELTGISLGQNKLISVTVRNQLVKTLVNAHTFQTDGQTYKMIAFHNISATMEEIEANAWKGLLSVMTHEIMNSIAPVASLADTLKKRMENLRSANDTGKHPELEDIELAMDTIHRRSEGLLRFADNYRSLSKTIIPDIRPVAIGEIVNVIYQLMQPSLVQKNISLEMKMDNPTLMVSVDRSLIEQVLINFITNAAYAVKDTDNPQIILYTGVTNEDAIYITVADNGRGIAPEVREKIFIPFFSTKKNGTGIGLSLSRDIVKLHHGSLQVQSKEGEGSAFTILLPGT